MNIQKKQQKSRIMYEYRESIEKDKVIQNHVIDSSYTYIVKKLIKQIEYYTCSISNDESTLLMEVMKYLRYTIYNKKNNQRTKIRKISFGSYEFVCEYIVQRNFKLIQKLQLYTDYYLSKIIIIKNKFIITISYDGNIIKTATKLKKQLFKLLAHTNSIQALDYNEIDDIIVSGSHDKSIKLWSGKDKYILINKVHQNTILQIQLINNNKNLLIQNGGGQLQLWKIDLVNRNLIKLDDVFNFYQVNQGQNLILFQYQCNNILNNQGQIINYFNYIPGATQFMFIRCKNICVLQQLQSAKFKSNQQQHRFEMFILNNDIYEQEILNRRISYLFDLIFSSVSSSQDMLEKQPENNHTTSCFKCVVITLSIRDNFMENKKLI